MRRVVTHQVFQLGQAFGVVPDEVTIYPVFPQQQMQNPMEQGDIGARQDRQVQVSQIAGICTTWVYDNDLHLRPAGFGCFQAAKQHRVGVGHVAADDHHAIAQLQVFVAAGRGVGTQAALVADHRRGHAQARIAVDVVGAYQGTRQLVEGVVVLGQQLPGNVERHAVRAMFGNGRGKHAGGVIEGGIPIGAVAGQAFTEAQFGVQRPRRQVAGQVQGRTLAAQFAEIGRVRRVAADAEDA
ncbi:hypothetical protein D3C76_690570 [compost metagenome]